MVEREANGRPPEAGTADATAEDAQRARRRAARSVLVETGGGGGRNKGQGGGGRITPEQIREQLQLHEKAVRDRQRRRRQEDMLEKGFRRRNVATLKEAQDALNIAFGAILSAYVGNVLAGIDNRAFSMGELAYFFVLIGLFIAGLCIGNSALLRGHRGLSAGFLLAGFAAAYLSLGAASTLGFELPILKVMYICWTCALLAGDLVLTGIIYIHHQRSVK